MSPSPFFSAACTSRALALGRGKLAQAPASARGARNWGVAEVTDGPRAGWVVTEWTRAQERLRRMGMRPFQA